MADIPLPADMAGWMSEVEQRLRQVETRPQLPLRTAYNPTQNITNTSWAVLPNGPSVTVNIGPSRLAYVTVVSDMGLNQANQTGYLGFYTGSDYFPTGWMSITSSAGVVFTAGTVGVTRLAYNLPVGPVTFTAAAFVSTGNVNFSNTDITVQPI